MVDILTRGDTFFTQYKSTNNHMRFGMCLVGHSLCCPVVWWKFCRRFRGSTRRSNPQDSHLSSLLSFLVFFLLTKPSPFASDCQDPVMRTPGNARDQTLLCPVPVNCASISVLKTLTRFRLGAWVSGRVFVCCHLFPCVGIIPCRRNSTFFCLIFCTYVKINLEKSRKPY